jgi:PKD repeat protein
VKAGLALALLCAATLFGLVGNAQTATKDTRSVTITSPSGGATLTGDTHVGFHLAVPPSETGVVVQFSVWPSTSTDPEEVAMYWSAAGPQDVSPSFYSSGSTDLQLDWNTAIASVNCQNLNASCFQNFSFPAIRIPDGTYYLQVDAYSDQVPDGFASQRVQIHVANGYTPPIALNAPADGATLSGTVPIDIDWADTSYFSGGWYFFDYRPHGSTADWSSTQGESWDTTQVPDGQYDVRAADLDEAGNQFTSPVATVTVHNEAPGVTITSPADGATVGTATLAAHLQVPPAAANLRLDWVFADTAGNPLYVLPLGNLDPDDYADGSEDVSIGWDSTVANVVLPGHNTFIRIPDGSYQLRAVVSGDDTTLVSDPVGIAASNGYAPPVTITAPSAHQTVSGPAVAVTAALSSTAAQVDHVTFSYRKAGAAGWTQITTDFGDADPLTIQWDTSALTDGAYELSAQAFDGAGNTRSSAVVPVTVSNTTITLDPIAGPHDLWGQAVPLSGTFTKKPVGDEIFAVVKDANGDIAGEMQATDNGDGTWSASWDTTAFDFGAGHDKYPDGDYTVVASIYDNQATAIASSGTQAVTVANHGTLTVDEPASGSSVGGSATPVSGTVSSDAVSVKVYVNDNVGGGTQLVATATPSGGHWLTSWDTTGVPDGTYFVHAVAVRPNNATFAQTSPFPVSVDNTAGWPACGGAVTTECIAGFTVDGAAPPAGVELVVAGPEEGVVHWQVIDTANADPNELAPALTASSHVTFTLRTGSDYTGTSFTGSAFGTQPGAAVLTVDAAPHGASIGDGQTADETYTAYLGGHLDVLDGDAAGDLAGYWVTSTASDVSAPGWDGDTLDVDVSGPHLAADGTTPNVGRLSVFVPAAFLQNELGFASTTGLVAGNFDVREDGNAVAATLSAVAGGVVLSVPPFGFSAHTFSIGANGGPTADFDAQLAGNTVTVTDRSTDDGGIVSWAWDFGDGATSGVQSPPAHTYAHAGAFVVKLTVADAAGLQGTKQLTVHAGNKGPIAALTSIGGTYLLAPNGGSDHGVAILDASGSTDADGSIVDYRWSFGDGTPTLDSGAAAVVGHDFPALAGPKTYTVTVTVTDDGGASSQKTLAVTVAPSLTFTPPKAAVKKKAAKFGVSFKDKYFKAGAASIDWGDGASTPLGKLGSASHAYLAAGTFQATLNVTIAAPAGCPDDAAHACGPFTEHVTVPVTVTSAPPKASIAVTPKKPTAGAPIQADGSKSSDPDGTVASYRWSWGDGSADTTGPSPTAGHTYAAPGKYVIHLVVTDDDGTQSKPAAKKITVK